MTLRSLNNQIKQLYKRADLALTKPSTKEDQRPGLFVVSPVIVDKLFGVSLTKLRQAAADDPTKEISP